MTRKLRQDLKRKKMFYHTEMLQDQLVPVKVMKHLKNFGKIFYFKVRPTE